MGCNKASMTCGKMQQAVCVSYEQALPDYSTLACPNMEEVATELYSNITAIKDLLDMSALEVDCITYPSDATLLQVLQAQQNKICSQNELIITMQATIETMQEQIEALQQNICP